MLKCRNTKPASSHLKNDWKESSQKERNRIENSNTRQKTVYTMNFNGANQGLHKRRQYIDFILLKTKYTH